MNAWKENSKTVPLPGTRRDAAPKLFAIEVAVPELYGTGTTAHCKKVARLGKIYTREVRLS